MATNPFLGCRRGERTQPVSKAPLGLTRLRRLTDEIVAAHGQDAYDQIEADLHWEVCILLRKLEPVVHVLRTRWLPAEDRCWPSIPRPPASGATRARPTDRVLRLRTAAGGHCSPSTKPSRERCVSEPASSLWSLTPASWA